MSRILNPGLLKLWNLNFWIEVQPFKYFRHLARQPDLMNGEQLVPGIVIGFAEITYSVQDFFTAWSSEIWSLVYQFQN